MVAKVQKWDDSLGVRISKSFAAEVRVRAGSSVKMNARDGQLLVRPVKVRAYTLGELVSKITPKNRHPETDWGPPVGREIG